MATTAPPTPDVAHGHDPHGDGHGHPAHLQHHFVSSEQQFDAAKMGMWMFLVTEILLFSGMFVAYLVYRVWHPEVFVDSSSLLDWELGALNTIILLSSSLTAALGVRCAQTNNQRWLVINLLLTIAFAAGFLIVKYFEYSHKFELGELPGQYFDYHGTLSPEMAAYAPIFFSIYFVMTGIHGFHVVVGMGIFAWVTIMAVRGRFHSEYYTHVEISALYWHLVDLIWIFLFPLLYLI